MVRMLGDPDVRQEEKYHVKAVIGREDSIDAIQALVEGATDERAFDPKGTHAAGAVGEVSKISVGDVCIELLNSIVRIDRSSAYIVRDWKLWWATNKGKSLEQIRSEIGKFNEEHPPK